MQLVADALTLLMEEYEQDSDGGYPDDIEWPWHHRQPIQVSVLIQPPAAGLVCLPPEAVVAVVQAVADVLQQKMTKDELAMCCMRVSIAQHSIA